MTLAKTKSGRHLIGLKGMSEEEIKGILNRAAFWAKYPAKVTNMMHGSFIANMFFENSTRTRFSFEVAQKRLGVEVLNFTAAVSSVQKGESIYDTVKTLESMGLDAGVVRIKPSGVLQQLADKINMPLINAGDGNNEHPTQALLDMYTMQQHFGSVKGLNVSIIGDVKHSRVARSNLWGLKAMGANVRFCAPDNMKAPELDDHVTYVSLEEALQADVIMPLRVQLERHEQGMITSAEAYREHYGITVERERLLSEHAIIMHPAPVNRGVEIDDELVEHSRSRIFQQIANGVPIRMAVIERALSI